MVEAIHEYHYEQGLEKFLYQAVGQINFGLVVWGAGHPEEVADELKSEKPSRN